MAAIPVEAQAWRGDTRATHGAGAAPETAPGSVAAPAPPAFRPETLPTGTAAPGSGPAPGEARALPPEPEPGVPLHAAGDVQLATRSADPAPSGSVAAPGPGSETARSVAGQIVLTVHPGREGSFEMSLSPEELGKVTLSVQVSDGAVTLAIQAERPETLELMRRHSDLLEREFGAAGYASVSFSFGQGSADGRPPGATAHALATRDAPAAGAQPPDPARPAGRVPSSSRLDLRL